MGRSIFGGGEETGSGDGSQASPFADLDLRRASRLRRKVILRLALTPLLVGFVIWFQFFSSFTHHNAADNVGPMLLKAGDCFQEPKGTTLISVSPVPCSAVHTAQLYKLYTPGSFDCFGALDITPTLGDVAHALFTFTEHGGGVISACVIVTPPTTGSLM